MRNLRRFNSVEELNAALASSTIGLVGLAFDDHGKPVVKTKEATPPTPPTNLVISCENNTVTITATNATTLEYNTDGSSNYTTYTQPFEISQTVTVYAKATNAGGSITGSQECEYVEPIDYSIPFYIDVRGAVTLAATSGLQMSTDGTNWTNTTTTTLSSGKTYFRVASDRTSPLQPNWTESDSSDYDIGGNINSLVKVNFANDTNCYIFVSYFESKSKLKSAGDLILPATTLDNQCYFRMFQGCRALTTAPVLPATTLASSCYNYMFYECTSLTTAPVLPATTLADSCYGQMFYGCTSLTTAPALPATTLAQGCYNGMFRNCTALTTAPALPATTLADSCYYTMFNSCTSLTTAPELLATTLTQGCYQYMFYGCTNLNYIKCLATNISASDCTTTWVKNVAASGTFVKHPNMSSWTEGNNGIPSGWTVQDATA